MNLGYKKKDSEGALAKAVKEGGPDLDLEALLKGALRALAKD